MATPDQIAQVRLNIDDRIIPYEFDDTLIESFIDEKDSISYATYKLIDILIIRLRKEIIKADTSGSEKTDFQSLQDRLEILEYQRNKYKHDYESEQLNTSGKYVDTIKPIIAGGMT